MRPSGGQHASPSFLAPQSPSVAVRNMRARAVWSTEPPFPHVQTPVWVAREDTQHPVNLNSR